MKSKLKVGGTLCALGLGIVTILRPVQAANENPFATASLSHGETSSVSTSGAPRTVDRNSAAFNDWRVLMEQNDPSGEGCFHASFPSTDWEKLACVDAQPTVHPVHAKRTDDDAEVVGNGNDFVAEASKGLLTKAIGNFFPAIDVASVDSVGVAAFGDGGILGQNEYSVQLNTNDLMSTAACAGVKGCKVWQQFVYATDYIAPGKAAVFMQYWLINFAPHSCPGGWMKSGDDCYVNSALTPAPDFPITYLGDIEIKAKAASGGNDSVTVTYLATGDVYSRTSSDSVLDIATVWNKAEFNVLGDAGGSRAKFNSGTELYVNISLYGASSMAAKCLANAGTTGETNNLNLNLSSCVAVTDNTDNDLYGLTFGPTYIEFEESN
jgi:hypothetical protein